MVFARVTHHCIWLLPQLPFILFIFLDTQSSNAPRVAPESTAFGERKNQNRRTHTHTHTLAHRYIHAHTNTHTHTHSLVIYISTRLPNPRIPGRVWAAQLCLRAPDPPRPARATAAPPPQGTAGPLWEPSQGSRVPAQQELRQPPPPQGTAGPLWEPSQGSRVPPPKNIS